MDALLNLIGLNGLLLAAIITLVAGVVKGAVGFGMPMLMISGLSSFLAPELALAALILPTVLSNGWQALRQGPRQALHSIRRFWVFLVVGAVFLIGSAQLVRMLSQAGLLLIIGGPVVLFSGMQLLGFRPKLSKPSVKIEAMVAAFAGFIGGMSGVWGPPTVAYLTAIDTPKTEQIRVQGVIYGLGAVVLLAAHMQSGVIRAETLPLSALMIPPALVGMGLGFLVSDRFNQVTFRKATLFVLFFAGLNLLRRAWLS